MDRHSSKIIESRQVSSVDDLESYPLIDALALWRDIKGDRTFPSRNEFDPMTLRDHLGRIILIGVETDPQRFFFRLIGTYITEVLSRDMTGRYLDDVYEPRVLSILTEPLKAAIDQHEPVRSTGSMFHVRKGDILLETVDLPLSDNDRDVNRILRVVNFDGYQ